MSVYIYLFGAAAIAGAAILAYFLRSSGQSYGRAFFWSLLMLIGLMALLAKIFSS